MEKWKLIIEDDAGETISVPIDREEISIGRNDGNSIRLTERNVSRHHAKLNRENGHVFIEDLSSYNGVKINGDKIKGTIELQEGDLIEIGDYHLAIQNHDAVNATSPDGLPQSARSENIDVDDDFAGDTAQWEPPGSLTGRRPDSADTSPTLSQRPTAGATPPRATVPNGVRPPMGTLRGALAAPIMASDDDETEVVPRFPSDEDTFPRFVAITTYLAGQVFPFDGDVLDIGRTDANSITVDHKSVSRAHAKVLRDGKHYRIKDRGSSNGILLNGKEVRTAILKSGDVAELGRVRLRFVDAGEEFTLGADEIARAKLGDEDDGEWGDDKPTTLRTAYSPDELAALRRGPPLVGWIAGIAGLILLGIVFIFFSMGGDDQKPETPAVVPAIGVKPAPLTPPTPGKPKTSAAEADAALTKANALRRESKWVEASEAFDRALDLGAKVDGAVLQEVNDEASAATQLEKARSSFNAGDYGQTLRLCQLVIDVGQTQSLGQAQELKKKAEGARIDELKTAAEAAIKGKDDAAAKTAIEELRELDQGALALALDKKRRGGKLPRIRPKPRPRPKPVVVAKPRVVDVDFSVGPSKDDLAESRALVDQANGAIFGGSPKRATTLLRKAESLDPSPTALYRLLGLSLELTGKKKQAVSAYKKYLRRNPAAPDRAQIQKILKRLEEGDK